MNIEIGNKWVEKLRSGEYQQAREQLRSKDNGYCCLGVLCEVYREDVGNSEWILLKNQDEESYSYEFLGMSGMLPNRVIHWAGMSDSVMVGYGSKRETLTALNDILRLDFNKIADVIEADMANI